MQGKELLVMDLTDPAHKLHIEFVPEDAIPEHLNGESGFHIYHVRALTELILRQMSQSKTLPSYAERDIQAISLAACLHDVGKSLIPSGILEQSGRLTPLEFDIVKKHTTYGEGIIAQAQAEGVDPRVLAFARQIAREHHERIDGTGYPYGLEGKRVSICSQVVALADAYDALTRQRSYKQAYSQDVAVQMIASGMCGVFQEELVECLIQVVNHKSLVALRQRIRDNRRVIAEERTAPKQVLCVGNTDYITADFLDTAFPESRVVVMGNGVLGSKGRIKALSGKNLSLKRVFETYDFDAVVYFSASLSYQRRVSGDAPQLEEVLRLATAANRAMSVVFLSSPMARLGKDHPQGILAASLEQLCQYYAGHSRLDIKILRIPYLYSALCPRDWLYTTFENLRLGKPVIFEEVPQNRLSFLSMQDLGELLRRLLENWESGGGVLTVGDSFHQTFGDLEWALYSLKNGTIHFRGTGEPAAEEMDNKVLRSHYGWVAKVSVLEDLPEQYQRYLAGTRETEQRFWQRVQSFFQHRSTIGAVAELLLLFFVTEVLLRVTDSTVVFSVVDFRMAYIVILALTHGLRYGLAASGLCSLSWLVAKVASGTNWLTLFYEPTNWLAFVYYFLVGGLCGYIRIRSEDKIRFGAEEKKLLEEKLVFTRELYEDTYREKRDLKKQIIGSKDSFGKIFDIARKLDTVEVPMLYLRAVEAFETVLENRSLAIYSVNDQATFGRLEVASRDTMELVTRSISLDTYAPIVSGVADGEVWRNRELRPEFPMYAAGVHRDGKLAMLIFLWQAEPEQQTLYYANLFKILKELVQMSLLRALQYNQAVYARQYLPGTGILNEQTFASLLANVRQLAQQKVSQFLLLDIDIGSYSLAQADTLLAGKIRQNDALGMLENGHVGMLLSQATQAELEVIMPRFRDLDMTITVSQ